MNKPYYLQIKEYILNNIENNKYLKTNKIESEHELVEIFKVSRMTVRQAISELVKENVLYSIKRKGTYINNRSKFKEFNGLNGFSEDAEKKNCVVTTKIIEYQLIKASEKIVAIMKLNDDDKVWHIKRVRLIDNEPVAFEDSYYNYQLTKELNNQIINKSLYQYFENKLKLELNYSDQEIDACLSNQLLSNLLEVEINNPLLRILQTTYLTDGRCLEYGYTYYRTDRYTFTQVAYRKK